MREFPVYQPKDFAGDTPPPRIIGSETEYLASSKDKDNSQGIAGHIVKDIISGELSTVDVGSPNFRHPSGFIINGGRTYQDCGMIEMATAESLGPAQAVETDRACQRIVQEYAAKCSTDSPFEIYRRVAFVHNLESESTGRHINLLTPPADSAEVRARHARFIGSYLAARALWGTGMVGRRSYTWSQKFAEISTDDQAALPAVGYGRRTGQNKPILSWTTSKLGGSLGMEAHSKGWDRLEIRMADAPHSDFMRLLDFGGASLILRLVEHESQLPKKFIKRNTFDAIAMAARDISQDLSHNQSYKTVSGEYITALQLLKNCFTTFLELSEKVQAQPDELLVAQYGLQLAEDFERVDVNNPETLHPLLNRMDLARRFLIVERAIRKSENKDVRISNTTAVANDLLYDQIYPKSVADAAWEKSPALYTANPHNVEYLMKNPPRQTRAYARTESAKRYRPNGMYNLNWDLVCPEEYVRHKLSNPYSTRLTPVNSPPTPPTKSKQNPPTPHNIYGVLSWFHGPQASPEGS